MSPGAVAIMKLYLVLCACAVGTVSVPGVQLAAERSTDACTRRLSSFAELPV